MIQSVNRSVVGPLCVLMALAGCAGSGAAPTTGIAATATSTSAAPTPDPRLGLKTGLYDAGVASWNMSLTSTTPSSERFSSNANSDLAFTGQYVIQGNFNGFQVWDIANPALPNLVKEYFCPASQSDVSVYRNLLFVSGEGMEGRLDCAAGGNPQAASKDRLRGLRIFDISDIRNPKYIGNVQTCRGSHTHSLLVDPKDAANVYVYISGSAPVRPEAELPGCAAGQPSANPNTAMFRIEIIKVPLANPSQAAIVSSPRIFEGLEAPPTHGGSPADQAEMQAARARGAFIATVGGQEMVLPDGFVNQLMSQRIRARGGSTTATAADSAGLREALPGIIAQMMGGSAEDARGPRPGPNQCHDITLYPAIGLAGGACEGYGLLLDISDPVNPRRIDAVADSNFSYWHSATFNNDGTKVLFTDEWGGGGAPKCRVGDPRSWGANANFSLTNGKLKFESYYKLPVTQTSLENCVAHNGSPIPIPGRDVMVQAWYQGGLSVFDWTNIEQPVEIAYFDRGPLDPSQMVMAGSWSVYWYNGLIVSSEIARGLDILELTPSPMLTRNEIDAAKTVVMKEYNAQMQPQFVWPASFPLARAYLDQLARNNGLAQSAIASARTALAGAEQASGATRRSALNQLAAQLDGQAGSAADGAKVRTLATAVRELAGR
ncbi:MAG: hypothetical protein SFU57_07190 [Gemmatimonadales bacterium]|nr:hypothetical protein [Gemmatimonadales bacterium]